ncbi:MAG: cytochrome P450, partial [Sciscionella sp.]
MTETSPVAHPCPEVDYRHGAPPGPVGSFFTQLDGYQDIARPAVRTNEAGGYWLFTDHAALLDGLKQPGLWSSSVIVATEPDPSYRWIPIMLDPPVHTKWRKLLGSWFTPARVKAIKDEQHKWAAQLAESLRARGECDFVRDFAQVFPAMVFLDIVGMPMEKLDEFLVWEHMMLHQNSETDPDGEILLAGMKAVQRYFAVLIAQRRARQDPDARDLVSAAATWEIDGAPIPDEDILNCLLLLFMAGLDTVAGEASYAMHHLATHRADRARIVDDPGLIPHAVDELLRAYSIVQVARTATRDAEFHGCAVRKGDRAQFSLSVAGRDELVYSDARTVDFDREDTRNLAFGAGPHVCPGSH